jgi:hypothetical protein
MVGPSLRKTRLRSRLFSLFYGAAVFPAVLSAALNPSEWKYRQTVEVSAPGLTKIALPDETLDLARADLADLRLVGPTGAEVPFAIEQASSPRRVTQVVQQFRVELQKVATQITFRTGTSASIEQITLLTPATNFVKAATLSISSDGQQWQEIGSGFQLARQQGIDALSLPLYQSASYVRVTVDDERTPTIPFTSAVLQLAPSEPAPAVAVNAAIVRREEFVHESVITVDLHAKNLPLSSLDFSTSAPLFNRTISVTQRELRNGEAVEQVLARGSIFRSRLRGTENQERLLLPLAITTSTREIQVHVLNNDDAPLPIDAIRVQRRPSWIVFTSTAAGRSDLLMGKTRSEPPSYDLGRFAAEWKTLPETALKFSAAQPNPGYAQTDELADAPLFGAKLDVRAWKYRKAMNPTKEGAQEIELDLDVLAHTRAGLSDLRLVRDGLQIPYLLERAPLRRALTFKPAPETAARTPRLSRWRITLPHARLPFDQLTLISDTRVFERSIEIYEESTDDRGEKVRRVLASDVQWSRTPERSADSMTIPLTGGLTTNTLIIEADNGDNPPISLTAIRIAHPVTRLLFRSEAKPLYLYYGASVTAPRYDLELMAARLLSTEKSQPSLGPEERADGTASDKPGFLVQRAGVLLWGSLAMVVAALLFAVARLLPKPTKP